MSNPAGSIPKHWDGGFPVQMKRPLAALLMDNSFREDILDGFKKITIREGWRDYKVGEKVILCHVNSDSGWATMAVLSDVQHCRLKEVSILDLNNDGMEDLDDAIRALSNFYDGINADSLVTVLKWG